MFKEPALLAIQLPFGTGKKIERHFHSALSQLLVFAEHQETPYMSWLGRNLENPATESQKGLVLALCLIGMSAMCVILVWQAQIISSQRDTIHWLETARAGR